MPERTARPDLTTEQKLRIKRFFADALATAEAVHARTTPVPGDAAAPVEGQTSGAEDAAELAALRRQAERAIGDLAARYFPPTPGTADPVTVGATVEGQQGR